MIAATFCIGLPELPIPVLFEFDGIVGYRPIVVFSDMLVAM